MYADMIASLCILNKTDFETVMIPVTSLSSLWRVSPLRSENLPASPSRCLNRKQQRAGRRTYSILYG